MHLAAFPEYVDDADSQTVYVNPAEVACVRGWKYHSFRPAIAEIVLQSGKAVHVWLEADAVVKRLKEAEEG